MADKSVADQLRELGVKNANVLVRMAERGQLLALRCEMPQCYHHKGRGAFDPVGTPGDKWTPSRDHYPKLKSDGGRFVAENVRLSHSWCNKRDWGWRAQVRTQLAKGKSLADIAEFLNRKGVPPAHGCRATLSLSMQATFPMTMSGRRRAPDRERRRRTTPTARDRAAARRLPRWRSGRGRRVQERRPSAPAPLV